MYRLSNFQFNVGILCSLLVSCKPCSTKHIVSLSCQDSQIPGIRLQYVEERMGDKRKLANKVYIEKVSEHDSAAPASW